MEIASSSGKSETKSRQSRHAGPLLSIYDRVPKIGLSIESFADYGADRLQVLKKLEELDISGKDERLTGYVVQSHVLQYLKVVPDDSTSKGTYEPKRDDHDESIYPTRHSSEMKDCISHFILKLAHCKSNDLRLWFLKYEVMLFRYRFRALSTDEQAEFLNKSGLMGTHCLPLTNDEWNMHKGEIRRVHMASGSKGSLSSSAFYRVPFEKVIDLVAMRHVYMCAGWAYVPKSQMFKMASAEFRTRLSKGLVDLRANWDKFMRAEGERLGGIVRALAKQSLSLRAIGPDPKTAKAVLDTYLSYLLKVRGYSDPKVKENRYPGSDKFFLSVGSRKPNDMDRTCPFAKRTHKSNTQRFTVHVSEKVMVQRCWDGACENQKHFFQIQDGSVKSFGEKVPPPQPQVVSEEQTKGSEQPSTAFRPGNK